MMIKKELPTNFTRKRGFTIIEVVIAIFLITVGIGGTFITIQRVIAFTSVSSNRLAAIYLAQEGAEIIRNIRDTNWLEQRTSPSLGWTEGISVATDRRLDYQSSEFPDTTCNLGSGNYLKHDGNFYNCLSGSETKFKRKISIKKPEDYILEVSVLVEWEERGRAHEVAVQENLYEWR